MERSATSTPGRRRAAAAVAAAIACALLAGAFATGARADWRCPDFNDETTNARRNCDLRHTPDGTSQLIRWQIGIGVRPLFIENDGDHPARIERWQFGILRESEVVAARGVRLFLAHSSERIWGGGTTGPTRVRSWYTR